MSEELHTDHKGCTQSRSFDLHLHSVIESDLSKNWDFWTLTDSFSECLIQVLLLKYFLFHFPSSWVRNIDLIPARYAVPKEFVRQQLWQSIKFMFYSRCASSDNRHTNMSRLQQKVNNRSWEESISSSSDCWKCNCSALLFWNANVGGEKRTFKHFVNVSSKTFRNLF